MTVRLPVQVEDDRIADAALALQRQLARACAGAREVAEAGHSVAVLGEVVAVFDDVHAAAHLAVTAELALDLHVV